MADTPELDPQPQLLSFDIGTRHLAYCAFHIPTDPVPNQDPSAPAISLQESETAHPPPPIITHWKVVDLLAVPGTPHDESCVYVQAKGWKADQMRSYLDKRNLPSAGTRAVLLDRIVADLKQRKVPKVASSNLNVIALKLYAYLDTQTWMAKCRTVVLENQPCLTNPVMKSVQMLLYGYFLYKGVWCAHVQNMALLQHAPPSPGPPSGDLPRIMLTSASNKLKVCAAEVRLTDVTDKTQGGSPSVSEPDSHPQSDSLEPKSKPKAAYKARKQEAIALATRILEQWRTDTTCMTQRRRLHTWQQLLHTSCVKEQDDLSDSMLQGLFVLRRDGVDDTGAAPRPKGKKATKSKPRVARKPKLKSKPSAK